MFTSPAFQGGVGPSFQWNVLNYGRLLSAIRLQDARLAELIVSYQSTVLQADAETENGIAWFLRAQQRAGWLATSVVASEKAAKVAMTQYRGGMIAFNWVSLVEQNLVSQQDLSAQAQGEIVQGLNRQTKMSAPTEHSVVERAKLPARSSYLPQPEKSLSSAANHPILQTYVCASALIVRRCAHREPRLRTADASRSAEATGNAVDGKDA